MMLAVLSCLLLVLGLGSCYPLSFSKSGETHVLNVDCPGGKGQECPTNATCCPVGDGIYGCCPKVDAVCCPDKTHCCPKSYTCQDSTGKCYKEDSVRPSLDLIVPFDDIVCPDKKECATGSTCCLMADSSYGCCPKLHAVCCPDMKHCCPEGYTCADSKGECLKPGSTHPLLEVLANTPLSVDADVLCPDSKSKCPADNTCCRNSKSSYGCCPKVHAVCCSDMKHCCPEGYTCEDGKGECLRAATSHPLLELLARPEQETSRVDSGVVCPDGASTCPDKNTCCKNAQNTYGCCPVAHATCCSDLKHCCPEGYQCGGKDGECMKADSAHPVLDLIAQPVREPDNICPNGVQECPAGSTCCKNGDVSYGCCPKPNAVCCDDEKHCCPQGYSCGKDTCNNSGQMHPLMTLFSRPAVQDVIPPPLDQDALPGAGKKCPDGHVCSDSDATCCMAVGDKYGCCPETDAVCCPDKIHCCPEGYSCTDEKCVLGKSLHPLLHLKVREQEPPVLDVKCPDEKSVCPDKYTCCPNGADSYGCCPKQNAVCCADMKHCCPTGYYCDPTSGQCTGSRSHHPLIELVSRPLQKTPVLNQQPLNVNCPDGETECPDGYTCCAGEKKDTYACCPKTKGVCCPDHKHCCPEGFKCNTGDGQCLKDSTSHPLVLLLDRPAKPLVLVNFCTDDKDIWCRTNQTCCKKGNDKFSCCPSPNGVCCKDGAACCPDNYTCEKGMCRGPKYLVPFIDTILTQTRDRVRAGVL